MPLWQSRANDTFAALTNTTSYLSKSIAELPTKYTEYITSNAQSVSSVETTLRSLTYLLPGARFADTEIASESIHTFVQLLSIYHDRLLQKRADLIAQSPTLSKNIQTVKPNRHAAYTNYWAAGATEYSRIATFLKMIQYTELLWEMLAKRRNGEKSRWRAVVFLESLKAILRLLLLRLTQSRPLITPSLPTREDIAIPTPTKSEETSMLDELTVLEPVPLPDNEPHLYDNYNNGVLTPPHSDSGYVKPSIVSSVDPLYLPRTGHTLPQLPSPDTISHYLLNHILQSEDIKPLTSLVHQLSSYTGLVGEVLYILRPVIYALLMQRMARQYGHENTSVWRRKAWLPWAIGLAIEVVSRNLVKHDLENQAGRAGLSAIEKQEMERRKFDFAWWGMRGAFYENVSKSVIRGLAQKLNRVPILGLVGGVLEDYEALWSGYEMTTATM